MDWYDSTDRYDHIDTYPCASDDANCSDVSVQTDAYEPNNTSYSDVSIQTDVNEYNDANNSDASIQTDTDESNDRDYSEYSFDSNALEPNDDENDIYEPNGGNYSDYSCDTDALEPNDTRNDMYESNDGDYSVNSFDTDALESDAENDTHELNDVDASVGSYSCGDSYTSYNHGNEADTYDLMTVEYVSDDQEDMISCDYDLLMPLIRDKSGKNETLLAALFHYWQLTSKMTDAGLDRLLKMLVILFLIKE